MSRWAGILARIRWAYWHSRLPALGSDTHIAPHVVIKNSHKVSIGSRCSINEFVHVWGGGGVVIGNVVLVASHVVITSQTHDTEAQLFALTMIDKPIVIEDNVWIGAGAVILPGVLLGKGCIVGAGAVVTRSVESDWIVTGNPARPLRKRRVTA